MPIYEYRCDDCGTSFEVMQKMADDPLTTCEQCGGALHKVLFPVAIHFKGSGFYTTDYGRGSGRPVHGHTDDGDSHEGGGSSAAPDAAVKSADKHADTSSKVGSSGGAKTAT